MSGAVLRAEDIAEDKSNHCPHPVERTSHIVGEKKGKETSGMCSVFKCAKEKTEQRSERGSTGQEGPQSTVESPVTI